MKLKKLGTLASVVPAVAGAAVLTATPASAEPVLSNGCEAVWLSAPSPTAGYVQAQGTYASSTLPGICWVRVHAKVGNNDVYTPWQGYSSCCFATQRINAPIPYVISWAKIEIQRN
jgi:hypothetical protein